MYASTYRSVAVGSLVLGSCVLPLAVGGVAPVALQYERAMGNGVAPMALLAAAHFLIVVLAARVSCPRRQVAAPRVDFIRAAA